VEELLLSVGMKLQLHGGGPLAVARFARERHPNPRAGPCRPQPRERGEPPRASRRHLPAGHDRDYGASPRQAAPACRAGGRARLPLGRRRSSW
jgi:hypothetical protein